ncbi:MAG: KOW domain-containing RNA-binding protein [Clostridia bacterium]|nr:KOW domain-containing RNA-binding protein [Clostridia bacterium]
MAVVEIAENGVYVCDGKERPLENPKRKNPKHLAVTHYVLSPEKTATNRSLKKALKEIMSQTEREAK